MQKSATATLTAEFIGTFALIFVGAGSIVANAFTKGALGVTGIALAHGLILALMISALGAISGGVFNPAITVALALTGRMTWGKAVGYIIAQLVGAAAAGLLLAAVAPGDAANAAHLGATMTDPVVSPLAAVAIEAVLTFLLTTAALGAPGNLAGYGVGLVVAADILMGGPFTGGSMNPARTFGPAIAGFGWANHWVYWVGPIVGAVVAALVKDTLLGAKAEQQGGKAA